MKSTPSLIGIILMLLNLLSAKATIKVMVTEIIIVWLVGVDRKIPKTVINREL